MRSGIGIIVLLAALLPLATARADDCANARDQSTMNQCAEDALKKSDMELNALYTRIVQRLQDDAETLKLLVAAQRAWVGFRDAECAFQTADWTDGSAYPMFYAGCADALTKKRVDDFKTYLACEEGATGCPQPAQ